MSSNRFIQGLTEFWGVFCLVWVWFGFLCVIGLGLALLPMLLHRHDEVALLYTEL